MKLNIELLNSLSPYRLRKIDDLTLRFVNSQGVHYKIGFYPETVFMKEGAYHFFIDNDYNEHGSHDPKILDVITLVIEEFFRQEPLVMLYVCDSTDNRQAARDRLYHLWFYDYAQSHEMTLYSDSLKYDGVSYYAGLLMRHNHPLHDQILLYYQEFLKLVDRHYIDQGK